MSIVTVVVLNPANDAETHPFVPSTCIAVEDVPIEACVDACHEALGLINRDPEQRCGLEYFSVSNVIMITCDGERADINAIATQLRGHLANVDNSQDEIVLRGYTVGETVHDQVNERERHADL